MKAQKKNNRKNRKQPARLKTALKDPLGQLFLKLLEGAPC